MAQARMYKEIHCPSKRRHDASCAVSLIRMSYTSPFGSKLFFLNEDYSWVFLVCLSFRASKTQPHSYFMGSRGQSRVSLIHSFLPTL